MLKDVMRARHAFDSPTLLFETALDVSAVGEHSCDSRIKPTPASYEELMDTRTPGVDEGN